MPAEMEQQRITLKEVADKKYNRPAATTEYNTLLRYGAFVIYKQS